MSAHALNVQISATAVEQFIYDFCGEKCITLRLICCFFNLINQFIVMEILIINSSLDASNVISTQFLRYCKNALKLTKSQLFSQ